MQQLGGSEDNVGPWGLCFPGWTKPSFSIPILFVELLSPTPCLNGVNTIGLEKKKKNPLPSSQQFFSYGLEFKSFLLF